ncbi:hypothetical protein [Bradyrhizobium cenepequi]|uniref:hypothetical protein n=1 Tax=Bradyrhizobium cenepequi TaxID=2821403 RepID=UPI001CE3B4B4|nr:hypothetical protein [Bradyrhizobium cenepequi]MCA6108155.1 hypothetical protein [Bradyrhizobium cenepequi]
MDAVSRLIPKEARPGSERAFRSSAKPGVIDSVTAIVARVAQKLWPVKTDWALRHKTGASDRMCRYWLENKYSLSSDALACLLRSDEGFQFLEAIMGDATPLWWIDFKRSVKRAELRRQQEELAKAIEETG